VVVDDVRVVFVEVALDIETEPEVVVLELVRLVDDDVLDDVIDDVLVLDGVCVDELDVLVVVPQANVHTVAQ
jgi:hypothetical protein